MAKHHLAKAVRRIESQSAKDSLPIGSNLNCHFRENPTHPSSQLNIQAMYYPVLRPDFRAGILLIGFVILTQLANAQNYVRSEASELRAHPDAGIITMPDWIRGRNNSFWGLEHFVQLNSQGSIGYPYCEEARFCTPNTHDILLLDDQIFASTGAFAVEMIYYAKALQGFVLSNEDSLRLLFSSDSINESFFSRSFIGVDQNGRLLFADNKFGYFFDANSGSTQSFQLDNPYTLLQAVSNTRGLNRGYAARLVGRDTEAEGASRIIDLDASGNSIKEHLIADFFECHWARPGESYFFFRTGFVSSGDSTLRPYPSGIQFAQLLNAHDQVLGIDMDGKIYSWDGLGDWQQIGDFPAFSADLLSAIHRDEGWYALYPGALVFSPDEFPVFDANQVSISIEIDSAKMW